MKRFLLVLLLLSTGIFGAHANSIYEDALVLKRYIVHNKISLSFKTEEEKNIDKMLLEIGNPGDDTQKANTILSYKVRLAEIKKLKGDSVFSILVKYDIVSEKSIGKVEELNAQIHNNPFLKTLSIEGSLQSQTSFNFIGIGSLLSKAGATNMTSFADGLSKFLIKRGKEELLISVIEKLKDTTRFPEIPVLFPKTKIIFDNFESSEYHNLITTIREAFNKDMQNMLTNIQQLKDLKSNSDMKDKAKLRVQALETFFKDQRSVYFLAAIEIANGFTKGEKVSDIIHAVTGTTYLGGSGMHPEIVNAMKLIDILSSSIKSKDEKKDYISSAELSALLSDPTGRNVFFALLYQKLKIEDIQLNGVKLADDFLLKYQDYANYLMGLTDKGTEVWDAVKQLRDAGKKGEKDLTGYYASVFEAADNFLEYGAKLTTINPKLSIPKDLSLVFNYSSICFEIAHDVSIKNYNAAIVSTIDLMSRFKINGFEKFTEFYLRYGSFAANIVLAKDGDEAEQAIEAIALPAGSYSIKQKSRYNISLNGYIGYGYDVNHGNGVYAPLGFSFSAGGKKSGAITIFASMIDVGSVVSYRLTNGNSAELKQEVRLESIISPSLQVFYSIPSLPVAIGAGWKRTPKLFYSKNGFEFPEASKNVVNIALLIDIPIITLLNRTRK